MGELNIIPGLRVNELYNSIIFTAISRHCDLASLVKETERDAKDIIKQNFGLPTGFDSIYFIEALANKMGSTIGELYGMTEFQKESILLDLIKDIEPTDKNVIHSFYNDEEEEEITFGCSVSVINTLDNRKLSRYFRDLDSDLSIYAHYDLSFSKTYGTEDNPSEYSVSITPQIIDIFPQYLGRCEYLFGSYEVWVGTDGYFAEFIDRVIDEQGKAKQKKKPAAPKEEPIDFKSFFVYGGEGKCPDKTHNHQEKVMATVPILKKNMAIEDIEFEAWYCPECNVYYISNKTYNVISNKGRLLCQLLSNYEYTELKKKTAENSNLSPQSILNMLGYNVGSKDGFSAKYRQSILESAIETGIITKRRAIEYLEFFVRMNERNSSKKNAVSKWKEDIRFLRGTDTISKGKTRLVGIKRIISNEKANVTPDYFFIPDGIDDALPFK